MKFYTHTILLLSLTLSLATLGCDKKEAEPPAEAEATAQETPEKAEAPQADPEPEAAAKAEPLEQVEVAQAGTKFDPPVEVEQLPTGAWYCDMGTVHWASLESPEDGNCPLCHMKLKQHDPDKLAEQKKEAVEAHAHDHDDEHDHGDEHGHDDEHGHAH